MCNLIQQRFKDPAILNDSEKKFLMDLTAGRGFYINAVYPEYKVWPEQLICDGWVITKGSYCYLSEDNPRPFK